VLPFHLRAVFDPSPADRSRAGIVTPGLTRNGEGAAGSASAAPVASLLCYDDAVAAAAAADASASALLLSDWRAHPAAAAGSGTGGGCGKSLPSAMHADEESSVALAVQFVHDALG
jgi:hypothetical protein